MPCIGPHRLEEPLHCVLGLDLISGTIELVTNSTYYEIIERKEDPLRSIFFTFIISTSFILKRYTNLLN